MAPTTYRLPAHTRNAPIQSIQILPVVLLLLSACDSNDDDEAMAPEPEPPAPQRGELIGEAPTHTASYSPDDLLALATSNEVAQVLVEEVLTPECTIDVYHFGYQTVDPARNITPASGALMVPNDSAEQCQRERPILLYAHGTNPNQAFNIADLEAEDNGEGLLIAAVFAAEGYIVVAPNYAGTTRRRSATTPISTAISNRRT
jgi:hypothetical protein